MTRLSNLMLAAALVALAAASASPVAAVTVPPALSARTTDIGQIICSLPFVPRALCPRRRQGTATVSTPLGVASGVQEGAGTRFAVRYGRSSAAPT